MAKKKAAKKMEPKKTQPRAGNSYTKRGLKTLTVGLTDEEYDLIHRAAEADKRSKATFLVVAGVEKAKRNLPTP